MAVNEITLSGAIANKITLAASLDAEADESSGETSAEDTEITYDYVGE